MDQRSIKREIDRALDYLAYRSELVARAHAELGIPLADLLAAALRRHFSRRQKKESPRESDF